MIQQHTVDLNEVNLHYVEAPASGPALLFIPTLAQHAHVYAVDLCGHNLSGRTPGAYQLPDYGRDVAVFLQRAVGEPAFVAGHSLGGWIAMWLAAHHPALVRGIFLEDPPLYMTQPPRFQETGFYHYFMHLRKDLPQHHARGGTLEAMIEYISHSPMNEQGRLCWNLPGLRLCANEQCNSTTWTLLRWNHWSRACCWDPMSRTSCYCDNQIVIKNRT